MSAGENRTMPRASVIPVLEYDDVGAAIEWLCATFGFDLRWRLGDHRAQLNVGDGAVVVRERRGATAVRGSEVLVRVADVRAHHAAASARGARILQAPSDFPYGERQYEVEDPGGQRWVFSQSLADVAPEHFGAVVGRLA